MIARAVSVLLFVALAVAGFEGPAGAAEKESKSDFPVNFGGPFKLKDHRGKLRTDKHYRGRHMLIYFGYTSCPDICPSDLLEIADALERLGEKAEQVQPLFITVDPERDTPSMLRRYLRLFDDRIIGLTGSEARIAAAAKAYRVHRVKVPVESEENGEDYLVNHSPNTFLMDPEGKFVTLFPHDTRSVDMAATIAKYLN
jgi:protein SCO1/2